MNECGQWASEIVCGVGVGGGLVVIRGVIERVI